MRNPCVPSTCRQRDLQKRKATFALRPRKGDFKHHRGAQEIAWLVTQPPSPSPTPTPTPKPFPYSLSLSLLSLGCVSIFSGKQGVQLQPHILLLSLSKLHTNPTKISIPALGLPTGFFQPCFVGLHQAPIFDLTHRLPPSINTNPTSSSLFYCSSPLPPPPHSLTHTLPCLPSSSSSLSLKIHPFTTVTSSSSS